METEVAQTGDKAELDAAVSKAVALLDSGEIVALPTETVYGLAADALNPEAVARVFEAKERPSFDPLIVHISHEGALEEVAEVPKELAKSIRYLMTSFWPGAMTMVLPRKPIIPDIVTAGLPTVAVRLSADPIFTRVVKELGRPLSAPSANRFGSISPTSASAVKTELDGRIPLIVDGGACSCGLESTIIRPSMGERGLEIEILRHGPITFEQLKKCGKVRIAEFTSEEVEAPGRLPSHYAPVTPLRLLESPESFEPEPGKTYGLLSYRGRNKDGYVKTIPFKELAVLSPGSGKLPEAAVRFFHLLRVLDQSGVDEILAEPLPDRGLGAAIMDRLRRAAFNTIEDA